MRTVTPGMIAISSACTMKCTRWRSAGARRRHRTRHFRFVPWRNDRSPEIHLPPAPGVEEALVGGPHRRTLFQMEAVAGDTTIGHATAYVQCLEALGGAIVPARAQALRALALELERLANHVGDIGALSNDVGFLPTAAYCGRLRGDLLNMTATVCGSRFGRSLVRPGGVAFDLDDGLAAKLLEMLDRAGRDLKGAVALFFDTESVRGRMESTGVLSAETCRSLGIVGVSARAAGVSRDCRVYSQRAGTDNTLFPCRWSEEGTCWPGDGTPR